MRASIVLLMFRQLLLDLLRHEPLNSVKCTQIRFVYAASQSFCTFSTCTLFAISLFGTLEWVGELVRSESFSFLLFPPASPKLVQKKAQKQRTIICFIYFVRLPQISDKVSFIDPDKVRTRQSDFSVSWQSRHPAKWLILAKLKVARQSVLHPVRCSLN